MKKLFKKIGTSVTRAINSNWFKNAKPFLMVGAALVLILVILPDMAAAQTPATADPAAPTSAEVESTMNRLISFLVVVMEFLQRLLWPLLLLIGGLLKNDILFGAGMEETMLTIWVNIRNLVNILFVLVLLGIAFYNVLGAGEDYHIKTILPKFVLALVAVNFSFLAVKVVLDGVSVMTTAIFALPGAVERDLQHAGNNEVSAAQDPNVVCKTFLSSSTDFCTTQDDGKTYAFTDKATAFFARFDSHNAGVVMALNIADMHNLDKQKLQSGNVTLKELSVNQLFSIVLFLVYVTAFIALFIILLVRLVVLWTVMVLSPLIVLTFVLPDSLSGAGGDLKEKFIKTAIVPIPVSIVLSVGFIMLQALKAAQIGTSTDTLAISTLEVNLLTSGLSTLQDVIAALGMVAFIWVGVFEAAKGTYADEIVDRIKDAGQSLGKFVVSAPLKYLPIIPVYKGGEDSGDRVSLGAVGSALTQLPSAAQEGVRSDAQKLLSSWGLGGAGEIHKDIEKADSGAKLAGVVQATGVTQLVNPETQKKIFESINAQPKLKQEVESKIKDKKWWNEFMNKIKTGKANEEDMRKFKEEMATAYLGTAIPPEKKPDDQAAGQQPPQGQQGQQQTPAPQQASANQAVLTAIAPDAAGFKSAAQTFVTNKDQAGLNKHIQDRQEEVKKAITKEMGADAPKGDELDKQANKIIAGELPDNIPADMQKDEVKDVLDDAAEPPAPAGNPPATP